MRAHAIAFVDTRHPQFVSRRHAWLSEGRACKSCSLRAACNHHLVRPCHQTERQSPARAHATHWSAIRICEPPGAGDRGGKGGRAEERPTERWRRFFRCRGTKQYHETGAKFSTATFEESHPSIARHRAPCCRQTALPRTCGICVDFRDGLAVWQDVGNFAQLLRSDRRRAPAARPQVKAPQVDGAETTNYAKALA